jgi:hypothetical protein
MGKETWIDRTLNQGAFVSCNRFLSAIESTTPAISTVYDVIYATQSEGMGDQARIKKAMESFVPQCVRVISCSEYSAKAFCELYGYPMERVWSLVWGLTRNMRRPVAPILRVRSPYFLAVSCNTTRKNTPRLIQAFLRYALSGGAYDLTLAWTLPDDSAGGGGTGGAGPSGPCLGQGQ